MPSKLKFSMPPMHGGPLSPCWTWMQHSPRVVVGRTGCAMTVSLRPPLSDMPTPSGVEPAWPDRGHVRVVVVVHVVVHEHPARVRVGDRADAVVRAGAVLGRRVIAVLAVGVEAILVLVELGVLDHELATGVGPRVAERVELGVGLVHRLVALLLAGTDVVAGVAEVAGVRLKPRAATPVAREDPVLRRRSRSACRRCSWRSGTSRSSRGRRSCRCRSPPFHQTSLPRSRPVPPRKLQAVRFWTQTSLAFHTMIPLSALSGPPLPCGPKFWVARCPAAGCDPDLVPSTITVLRFIPRR